MMNREGEYYNVCIPDIVKRRISAKRNRNNTIREDIDKLHNILNNQNNYNDKSSSTDFNGFSQGRINDIRGTTRSTELRRRSMNNPSASLCTAVPSSTVNSQRNYQDQQPPPIIQHAYHHHHPHPYRHHNTQAQTLYPRQSQNDSWSIPSSLSSLYAVYNQQYYDSQQQQQQQQQQQKYQYQHQTPQTQLQQQHSQPNYHLKDTSIHPHNHQSVNHHTHDFCENQQQQQQQKQKQQQYQQYHQYQYPQHQHQQQKPTQEPSQSAPPVVVTNKRLKISPPSKMIIDEPHDNDVLCGCNGRIDAHEGNIWYDNAIKLHDYLNGENLATKSLAETIVQSIHQRTPPGRFLKQLNNDTNQKECWTEVTFEQAVKKTSRAIMGRFKHDNNPKKKQKIAPPTPSSQALVEQTVEQAVVKVALPPTTVPPQGTLRGVVAEALLVMAVTPQASTLRAPLSKMIITEPNKNDVLCARGGKSYLHEGNIWYRNAMEGKQNDYLNEKKGLAKKLIAETIVEAVQQRTPPGRFLKQLKRSKNIIDPKSKNIIDPKKYWIEITFEQAVSKTTQSIRDQYKNGPEESWVKNYNRLVEYNKKYNSFRVELHLCNDDRTFQNWVNAQRFLYCNNKLYKVRKILFDSIGFITDDTKKILYVTTAKEDHHRHHSHHDILVEKCKRLKDARNENYKRLVEYKKETQSNNFIFLAS
jgi:hypothetical protein